jgi:6-phosphogluconolactonase/glucosamine-6-phosphate isomerase/deaminase
MSWIQQFTFIMRSNFTAIREKIEDPERMLHQLIADMEEELDTVRQSVAAAIADEIQLGKEVERLRSEMGTWEGRAETALQNGNESNAKQALEQKIRLEERLIVIETTYESQCDQVAKLQSSYRDLEDKIRQAGGIDLQLLGVGRDGHIGFNEPTSSLASRTRIKTLTEETVEDNSRFFGSKDRVPIHVLTMGIGTIRDAKGLLLLALGESKASAIQQTVEGPISAMVPASVLQLHENTRVILDPAAASKLEMANYYHWVFDNKPPWQHSVPLKLS